MRRTMGGEKINPNLFNKQLLHTSVYEELAIAFPQHKTPEAIMRYASIANVLEIKGKNNMEKIEALIRELEKLRKKNVKP